MTTLDVYHYFPVSELVRLDDFTYVLAENTVKAAAGVEDRDGGFPFSYKTGADGERVSDPAGEGAANKAAGVNDLKPEELGTIIGVDYDLVEGDNDLYAATGDGTTGFGRIVQRNNDAVKVRFIMPLNDGYSYERDRNLILAFSTKEQADTLHGIILGGDFTLPSYLDGFQHVPYIGLTDEDKKPIPLDRDGKPSETEADLPEQTTKENDKTSKAGKPGRPSEADPGNPATVPEMTIQSTEAETTAATFGNDQSAQGNAAAVSESLSNLTAASTQGEEASETSESTYSDNENTETYGSEETYTDTYSESENTDDFEDITSDSGPVLPDETEWSAYEVGNPQKK